MDEVWRARDPRLNRDAALKVLPAALPSDTDRLRRFEQEARATGAQPLGANVLDHKDEVKIPKLPSLVHDAASFTSVKGKDFHGGLLDGLRGFYA